MNFAPLLLAISILIWLHHYSKHGHWYDPNDLRTLKICSHEFWALTFLFATLIYLAL